MLSMLPLHLAVVTVSCSV